MQENPLICGLWEWYFLQCSMVNFHFMTQHRMNSFKKVTDFGEKPGPITILFSCAKVLMETEIGIFIGQKLVPAITNALTLTMGLKPFLKLKPKMSVIMYWPLTQYQFMH